MFLTSDSSEQLQYLSSQLSISIFWHFERGDKERYSCPPPKLHVNYLYNQFTNCTLTSDNTRIGSGKVRLLIELSPSASPRTITLIIALGFASYNYQNNLPSASPRTIISIIVLHPIRLAYITINNSLFLVSIVMQMKTSRRYTAVFVVTCLILMVIIYSLSKPQGEFHTTISLANEQVHLKNQGL